MTYKRKTEVPERKDFDRFVGCDTEEGYMIYDRKKPSAWIKSENTVEM